MILSMTGFSSTNLVIPDQNKQRMHITMTLKSLNSRFFEVNCKLPYTLTHLETQLVKYFKSKLQRGNIYFTLHMTNPHALVSSIEPAFNAIASYVNALKEIKAQFPISGELTVSDLLAIPNVFAAKEEPLGQEHITLIMNAIDQLTQTLNQARIKEGALLAEDLQQRVKAIEQYLQELAPRAIQVLEQKKAQLFQTLKTALAETNQENSTEAQSTLIYNQLERIDIHEEIVRFKSHLANLINIIESPGTEKGKKIDFTLQELFREVNTMMAKCSDATISSLGINIKVELEKAREQTQNIV